MRGAGAAKSRALSGILGDFVVGKPDRIIEKADRIVAKPDEIVVKRGGSAVSFARLHSCRCRMRGRSELMR